MPSSTALPASSPNPTDTTTTSTPTSSQDPSTSSDTDTPSGSSYYNYFFLLLALAFLTLFLLLLHLQRRRKLQKARLQHQHGRAALVQDVSRFSPIAGAGLWSQRSPAEEPVPSSSSWRRQNHNRPRSVCNDSILEAGLDERGEAPPPYMPADGVGKAPPLPVMMTLSNGGEAAQVTRAGEGGLAGSQGGPAGVGEMAMCALSPGVVSLSAAERRPPGYRENQASEGGVEGLVRPATVVTVAERLSEVDLEEQPPSSRHAVYWSRIPPGSAGRWSSTRRLMNSMGGSM